MVQTMKFHHCCPPRKNPCGHSLEKSTIFPSGRNPSDVHVCVTWNSACTQLDCMTPLIVRVAFLIPGYCRSYF